jgi:hypothetical protein
MTVKCARATVRLAVLLFLASAQPAIAAGAAGCLNACSSRCYGAEISQAAQASCTQACSARCIAAGNAGGNASAPEVRWGAIFVERPPSGALGWSFDAPNSARAQSIAASECSKAANGAPCYELITFHDRCAVVVHALGTAGKVDAVYGKARPKMRDAETEAVSECRAKFKSCRIVRETCSRGGP